MSVQLRSQSNESAVACLAIVGPAHGLNLNLPDLRQYIGTLVQNEMLLTGITAGNIRLHGWQLGREGQ